MEISRSDTKRGAPTGPGWGILPFLYGAYAMVMVAGGHGAGFLWMFYWMVKPEEWQAGQLLGCVAVGWEIAALLLGQDKVGWWFAVAGWASLVGSAAVFILRSETLHYLHSIIGFFWLPFLAMAGIRGAQLWRARPRDPV